MRNLAIETAGRWTRLWLILISIGVLAWPALANTPERQTGGHYQAAQTALAKDQLEEASVELRLALQDNPLDVSSHYLLASVLAVQGEQDQAIVGFRRALTLDPSHPQAIHNLGTLLLQRGDAYTAAELLETSILSKPDYLPPYNSLAKAYYEVGLPELAVATYDEVLRLDPSNRVALENRAILDEAAGVEVGFAERRAARRVQSTVAQVAEAEEKSTAHAEQLKTESATLEVEETAPPPPDDATAESDPLSPEEGKKAAAPPASGSGKPPAPGDKPPAGPKPPSKAEKAKDLRELLQDLPNVEVELRANRIVATGWTTGPRERELLDRVLVGSPEVLDLVTGDSGDPQRMLEIDAVMFIVISFDNMTVGFNFLRLIETSFTYFASNQGAAWTGLAPPSSTGPKLELERNGWLFQASVDYVVNIANATNEQVAVLARPHLTTLSGTPASFLAGGEWVFEVSGINSGDIKPYPFGTSVSVTPTLLRTLGENGRPRVHMAVEASRSSVLEILTAADPDESVVFDKLFVTSEAVLDLDQTLILSGLNQRESRSGRSGVPVLRSIPILKYVFSSRTRVETNTAILILLTPRDPAFIGDENRRSLAEFVERRRALLQAEQGTEEDMRRFRREYPDWDQLPPNHFASHFFLTKTSEMYRTVSGADLVDEDLDLHLLGDESGPIQELSKDIKGDR